jgi:Zn-finger nucleic acid-binding protein/ribosomal protein S27AE
VSFAYPGSPVLLTGFHILLYHKPSFVFSLQALFVFFYKQHQNGRFVSISCCWFVGYTSFTVIINEFQAAYSGDISFCSGYERFQQRKAREDMNCKNCGAPMVFDHHKIIYNCEYCTSTYFPEESRDGVRATDIEQSLSCPVCRLPLVAAYIGKVKISLCRRCRGMLIEQPDFLKVIQYARSKVKEPLPAAQPVRLDDLKRAVLCPNCGKKMDTHPYAGPGNIIIDNCPRCTLNWLDHNELDRITHSPDTQIRGTYVEIDPDKLFKRKRRDRD